MDGWRDALPDWNVYAHLFHFLLKLINVIAKSTTKIVHAVSKSLFLKKEMDEKNEQTETKKQNEQNKWMKLTVA